ncbi:hypothetical protein OH492_20445 [Vibrio chagasii]|nr:hypothetical protein [Vibrio chagasii]
MVKRVLTLHGQDGDDQLFGGDGDDTLTVNINEKTRPLKMALVMMYW